MIGLFVRLGVLVNVAFAIYLATFFRFHGLGSAVKVAIAAILLAGLLTVFEIGRQRR